MFIPLLSPSLFFPFTKTSTKTTSSHNQLFFYFSFFLLFVVTVIKTKLNSPTIEDSFRKQIVVDEQACLLTILDTAGAEEFHSIRDLNMRHANGALLVFSITDRDSFYEIDNFHKEFLQVHDKSPEIGFPTLLVATKCDLSTSRKVTEDEAKEKASKMKTEYVETSAKNSINVEQAFHQIVRIVRKFEETTGTGGSGAKKGRICVLL